MPELFCFGGLNAAEAAEVAGVSPSAVNREFRMAKAQDGQSMDALQLKNAE